MFKMYKGLLPTPFSLFFKITTNLATRGHSAKITKVYCELDIQCFFFFSERVINRWNQCCYGFILAKVGLFRFGFEVKAAISVSVFWPWACGIGNNKATTGAHCPVKQPTRHPSHSRPNSQRPVIIRPLKSFSKVACRCSKPCWVGIPSRPMD